MEQSLTLSPTPNPRRFRAEDGSVLEPPPGWELLPPGDAGLTRRVKAAGPSWTVQEKRGRKIFSRGVWAPAANIAAARRALEVRRATPEYERGLEKAAQRRERVQAEYEVEFERCVLRFLGFAPEHAETAKRLAVEVTKLSAPVGSGTVARTARLSTQEKAESAVIAWLRHQTTRYESMYIARVKGRRREVRRELAQESRRLLDSHRRPGPHEAGSCPLCRALSEADPATAS